MPEGDANGRETVHRVRWGRARGIAGRIARRSGQAIVILAVAACFLLVATFSYSYVHQADLIQRLWEGIPARTSNIYASPRSVAVGEQITAREVADGLRQSGYSADPASRTGYFELGEQEIRIYPGASTFSYGAAARLVFSNGRVSEITTLPDSTPADSYTLEPPLLVSITDEGPQERTVIPFSQIPPVLVEAVVSAEDKRFFQHSGLDLRRILKAAYVDLRSGHKRQGASTITMQLARTLWLDRDKSWRRKTEEVLLTFQLEDRFTKEQIFQHYANEIYLGRRGTYNIHGFAAGARAFFGKSLRQISLPEAALLAGLIQRPSTYNPFRNPHAAIARRNAVLALMRDNGYVTAEEYARAVAAPLRLTRESEQFQTAPYFVNLVLDELQSRVSDQDDVFSRRIYTTLDLDLQHAAESAVRTGMKEVDARLRHRRRPQVALVAVDPRTGDIKALVGGRDYRESQLNRANALRQPGSAFKPFVYAAALETGVHGGQIVITPATTVLDVPTAFNFGAHVYEPANFQNAFHGSVTIRRALVKSMNVAAVKVAEMTGLQRVVDLADRAGLQGRVHPTPALALGAYEVTPLELAGAYTVFANDGVFEAPHSISTVIEHENKDKVTFLGTPDQHAALDSRVGYLMISMMEDVVKSGTAAGLRARGINVPVAAKTGTSRDGWFAGFTTKLLCIVWVGYDDGSELGLEGSRSAMPVWAAFMKSALELPAYSHPEEFSEPAGITEAVIDPTTGLLANPFCPARQREMFIAGTEPAACNQHSPQRFLYPDTAVGVELGATSQPPQMLVPEPPDSATTDGGMEAAPLPILSPSPLQHTPPPVVLSRPPGRPASPVRVPIPARSATEQKPQPAEPRTGLDGQLE